MARPLREILLQEILVITDAGAGMITLDEVQSQLGKLGLRIVSESDGKVLDAMAHASPAELAYERDRYIFTSIRDACAAELAARAER
jgi:hypothetical protein